MPRSTNKFALAKSINIGFVKNKSAEKIGEIRIKPSSILWKPKNAHRYHSVSLDRFSTWIAENGHPVNQ